MMNVPIPTLHLFLPLDQKLIELLKSLSAKDWKKLTLAKLWTVKDLAAHLLDGNLRVLALMQNYTGDHPSQIHSYQNLVDYLNSLNADWVRAMKRVSPVTLIELLEVTQQSVIDYYHSLELWAPAQFPVSWAGQVQSLNWFHIAREYTERWHHQQQMREAVGKEGIMEHPFFSPLINTFMMALPFAYRDTTAKDDAILSVSVNEPSQEKWRIRYRNQEWHFISETDGMPEVTIEMSGDTAWKLFTKALPETAVKQKIQITGNQDLAQPILKMVSVMA